MKTLGWIGRGLGLAGAMMLSITVAQAAESAKFTLDGAKGTVTVKSGSVAKAAAVGSQLATGDTVTTDKKSSADLGLVAGGKKVATLQLWESSSYTIAETTVDEDGVVRAAGTLGQGAISGSFSAKASGSSLSITSSKGTVVVQGSSTFLVQDNGNVYCYGGRITLTSGGKAHTITPGQSFIASTGTLAPHNLPTPLSVVSAPVTQVTTPTSPSQPSGN